MDSEPGAATQYPVSASARLGAALIAAVLAPVLLLGLGALDMLPFVDFSPQANGPEGPFVIAAVIVGTCLFLVLARIALTGWNPLARAEAMLEAKREVWKEEDRRDREAMARLGPEERARRRWLFAAVAAVLLAVGLLWFPKLAVYLLGIGYFVFVEVTRGRIPSVWVRRSLHAVVCSALVVAIIWAADESPVVITWWGVGGFALGLFAETLLEHAARKPRP
jgi:hypothetical protein